MGKAFLVWGKESKEKLLAELQKAMDKETPAPVPEIRCPKCNEVAREGSDGEPKKADMDDICKNFVAYASAPAQNWKHNKRSTIEQVQVLSVIDKLIEFHDPAVERVELSGPECKFLKDRWNDMGAMEIDIPVGMGQTKTEKVGWGNLGGPWAKVWLQAYKMVETATIEG